MRKLIVVGIVAPLVVGAASMSTQAASTASYVVMVKDGFNPATVATNDGVAPTEVWREVGGFAAELTAKQVSRLKADPAVEAVAADGVVASIPNGSSTPIEQPAQVVRVAVRRVGGLESPTAKIDGRNDRLNVDLAILDSGIDRRHPDLNVAGGFNCVDGGSKQDWDDRDGHGTMVAGFAAAIDNKIGVVGVAPGARLWAIRVADPDGNISDSALLCGLNWVIENADKIEVANMSLAGTGNDLSACGATPPNAIHEATCEMVRRGVTAVAAAGNDSMDAATVTPAAFPEVIAVSAMADYDGQPGGLASVPTVCDPEYLDDHLTSFSNYGAPVDIAAPGACVTSTYPGGQYAFSSGTSFATPLVSGAAALYIATHPNAKPAKVREVLVARAEPGPIPGDPDTYPEGVLNVRGL
jgi:subtilisin family serine protease